MSSGAGSFGFNASAVAFGGVIKPTRGKKTKPIQGRFQPPSVALSSAGGRYEQRLKKYDDDGIKFRNAETLVEGVIESDTIFTTTATSHLEDLDVFGGLVTADAITSTIRSQRNTRKDDDSIFTIDAKFHNLRIDGAKVNPTLDLSLFKRVPTYKQFVSFFSQLENMEEFAPRFGWKREGEDTAELFQSAVAASLASPEPIRCSLVTSRVDKGMSFTQDGYSLTLPEVGRIHLAEVLVKPALRRINMLRIELRKPERSARPSRGTTARTSSLAARRAGSDEYTATFVSGEGNGSQSIPP
jgi:hypothetical protein